MPMDDCRGDLKRQSSRKAQVKDRQAVRDISTNCAQVCNSGWYSGRRGFVSHSWRTFDTQQCQWGTSGPLQSPCFQRLCITRLYLLGQIASVSDYWTPEPDSSCSNCAWHCVSCHNYTNTHVAMSCSDVEALFLTISCSSVASQCTHHIKIAATQTIYVGSMHTVVCLQNTSHSNYGLTLCSWLAEEMAALRMVTALSSPSFFSSIHICLQAAVAAGAVKP